MRGEGQDPESILLSLTLLTHPGCEAFPHLEEEKKNPEIPLLGLGGI